MVLIIDNLEEKFVSEEKRNIENFLTAKRCYENKIPVHLLIKNRQWYNGLIVEFAHNFFIMEERNLGMRVVFFLELYYIEEMEEEDGKE